MRKYIVYGLDWKFMEDRPQNGNAGRTVQTVETSYAILDRLDEVGKAGVTELAEAMDISKSAVHRHLATLANRGRVRKIDGNYHSIPKETSQVQPTFEIIESLNRLDGATPAEIAEATEKSEDTVVEYLVQLEQAEYVVKQDDKYQNSLKFLDIGERVKYNTGIFDLVAEEVDKLANESDELALFSVMEHDRNVILYKAHGEEAIRTSHETGLREPLHHSALGKAILAELPEDRVRDIADRRGLAPVTEQTITEVDDLISELQTTRERGYAIDMEEAKPGMRCVAASVSSANNSNYGAISVAAPKSRMQGERFENEIPELVKGAANVIELNSIYVE